MGGTVKLIEMAVNNFSRDVIVWEALFRCTILLQSIKPFQLHFRTF